MPNTIVIQSHTTPLPANWIKLCLNSVKKWADTNQFDYSFHNDDLFDYIDKQLIEKYQKQIVILTDIARLKLLQYYLTKNYHTVIWCDADFLIFNPVAFSLPDSQYALGREVWIQHNHKNTLVSKTKVHNAFMMFRNGNHFLDFYTETAEHLLRLNEGNIPAQFIGPKFLTAIHNIAHCPVAEHAGMFSPCVIKDIVNNGGEALELFKQHSKQAVHGANLCSSMFYKDEVNEKDMNKCISILTNNKCI